jgi:hypothetical protein
MTHYLPAGTLPVIDAVTDADREWFEAHPHRRYRLRPTAIAELMPGEVMAPGSHTVVMSCGLASARMRLRVGRPPPRLRRDTDRCCQELIKAVEEAGYTLGGKTIRAAIKELSRHVGEKLG